MPRKNLSLPDRKSDDSPSQPNPLRSVIRSDLDEAAWHAEQVRYVQKLKAEADEDRKAEQESGKRLFNIPSPIPPECFREDSPRGHYLRRIFRHLFLPVVTPVSLITAPAGMGKTRECEQELRRMAGRVVYYYALTHELVDQVVADLKVGGYREVHPVRGRTAPEMCNLENISELSTDVAAAGLSVQAVLCGNPGDEDGELCPHFDYCKYQAQRLALAALQPPPDQPLIFVLPHPYLTTWPSFLPEPDLRIVDESCWQQFVKKSKLQIADLVRIADQATPKAQHVLRSITIALSAGPLLLKSLCSLGLTERAHFKVAKSWLTQQIKERTKAISASASLDFKKLRAWEAARHLVHQLSLEIEIDRGKSHSVDFPNREHPNTKDQIGIYSRHTVGKNVPIMLLDASGDVQIYDRIFDKSRRHDIKARRNADIYQVLRKAFSLQSMLGMDSLGRPLRPEKAAELRREIVQFIISRLKGDKPLLVVAQLAVIRVLESALDKYIQSDRIRLAHFNALRGLNSFEDCGSAIIIGRVQPSPGALEALARAIFWDDPKPLLLGQRYLRLRSTRQMADGSTQTEWIDQHPDPRVNAILNQLREREIEQAIDRLRLIHNIEPKDVFLLTNIPIEAEITATGTWRQFYDAGVNRIGRAILQSADQIGTIAVGTQQFEAVVLPFSRELYRCFPRIWGSPDAAKDSWDDVGKINGGRSQMKLIFGDSPHLIATFRRPGQRGPSSHALVAIRPAPVPYTAKKENIDPDTAAADCASTVRIWGPYQDSQDDLRAAGKIALQRLTGGVKIVEIEPAADKKSGR